MNDQAVVDEHNDQEADTWEFAQYLVIEGQTTHDVAVYDNPFGNIVLRRRPDHIDEGEAFICIRPDQARALSDALLRVARELGTKSGTV